MRIDVVLPTFNRASLLERTLDSLFVAERPDGLDVHITVVDNASTDGTRPLVLAQMNRFGGRLHYLLERTPGKPHALNSGIAATQGDLIGLIDDDEEIASDWFRVIWRHFAGHPELDFIGGKCLPLWDAPRPDWLGTQYLGVIGWVDPGAGLQIMDERYQGMLMGGNAVIRRRTLERVGPYSAELSRTGARLLGCEDEDMYQRLLAHGARGLYVPELVIFHHVPAARLNKPYFRRWCFWRGVSLGVIDRYRPETVPYLLGVPRYHIGRAVRGFTRMLGDALRPRRRSAADRFANELACWDLAGFVWGKHAYRRRIWQGPATTAQASARRRTA
jgi:glycosyltransferase involved in cell wall biosynthesis